MNKFIKKITRIAASLLTAGAVALGAFAESSGFRDEQELALAAKTPYDTKYVKVAWNTSEADTAGVPVALGDNVLMPTGNKVKLLSSESGEELMTAELNEKVSESCGGAVIGNTFVQPTRSGIYVINTQTMQVVSSKSFDGAVCTDAAMIDNLAYFGINGESGYEFVCVDLSNELKTVWEYKSEDRISSAAVYGDYVVFGCGSKLVSCDYKSGAATETEIGAEISGAPFAGEYAIYLSGADGNVYKLRLNDDGTAEDGTLTPCEVGGTLSSPLAWNGRVYVSSSEGFYILDSLNMDIMQSYPEIKSGTDPIVCYGNGSRVYLVAQSTDYWCLYSIYDIDDLDEPDVSQLAKLENFEGGRIAVGSGGTMYFRDGVGRLYALAVAPYSILMIVIKLILLLALIVILFIWLRQWAKQRNAKKPPQY